MSVIPKNTATLELEYGQLAALLTGLARVSGGMSAVSTNETMLSLFPQSAPSAAVVSGATSLAAAPLLAYLEAHGIPHPKSNVRPADSAIILIELEVEQLQILAGCAQAVVQTWDGLLPLIPAAIPQRAQVHAWRKEAVGAAADFLAACRLAGVAV